MLSLCSLCAVLGLFAGSLGKTALLLDLVKPVKIRSYPDLNSFTIENLSKRQRAESEISIEREITANQDFTGFLVNFLTFDQSAKARKITGLLNVPKGDRRFPLVILIRGYVDQTLYETGVGTRRVGEFLASNGFITVAPDYLGYGASNEQDANIFKARFETYTTTLDLLASLDSIPSWDKTNLFIWAHSNGGYIALVTLEATGQYIPTSLWAPVSKAFPYSVLYYTDESADGGKFIRSELARFEEYHTADLFSIQPYLGKIGAPIQLHQGGADAAVPIAWTTALASTLTKLGKQVTYFKYLDADHNMNPDWNAAIQADLEFFRSLMR